MAIIALLLLNSVWNLYFTQNDTRLQRKKLEQELTVLKAQEAQLRTEIERLSNPQGVEEEIRSKFEVSKDGESVMVIINPEEENNEISKDGKKGFWSNLFRIFKR